MKLKRFFLRVLCLVVVTSTFGMEMRSERNIEADYAARQKKWQFIEPAKALKMVTGTEAVRPLKFLYAYMPTPDVTDYSPRFYVEQVKVTLRAKAEMAWGTKIPEREWYHFVLPLRVNNERLDSFRTAYYEELKARVMGLTMEEAALAVNRWCHEHVTYKPSDARTASPLASMQTATGRCGEESTFTVAALRAVGIPARQVYTPRWAHTDDNHAWVEVWIDGRWRFLGACEPEPVLDLGWFNAPAARGILMHTKVFGRYDGPEDKIVDTNCYTEINITDNYAKTTRTLVKVVTETGIPVNDAEILFKLYNYGEFFTVFSTRTNKDGIATIKSGLGDMVAWSASGDRFGFARIEAGSDSAQVVLNRRSGDRFSVDFKLIPPTGEPKIPFVSPEAAASNERNKAREDSIRHAYIATFPREADIEKFSRQEGYVPAVVWPLVERSKGNHANVLRLLREFKSIDVTAILGVLTEKDLCDFDYDVLSRHLKAARLPKGQKIDDYDARYLYSPRIALEHLSLWRERFAKISVSERKKLRKNPSSIVRWIERRVNREEEWNPQQLFHFPENVYRQRVGGLRSMKLLFVAVARSIGIYARIDEVTAKVQYALKPHHWIDVHFDAPQSTLRQGRLSLSYTPLEHPADPHYYTHFSISKIENGLPRLLTYSEEDTWQTRFSEELPFDVGDYILVSGMRMADGSVLVHVEGFPVKEGMTSNVPLVMRSDDGSVQVIGGFNSENAYHDLATGQNKSLLSTTGRGYFVVGCLRPNHEPTYHILKDISTFKTEFEAWGRPIVLLFSNHEEWKRFEMKLADFPNLPSTIVWGIDTEGNIEAALRASELMKGTEHPMVIIADTFNRVLFRSQGYTIGLGEQIKQTIGKINHP